MLKKSNIKILLCRTYGITVSAIVWSVISISRKQHTHWRTCAILCNRPCCIITLQSQSLSPLQHNFARPTGWAKKWHHLLYAS